MVWEGDESKMTLEMMVEYIIEYGALFIFLIVYLEQINFPGLGAAILYPAIGAFIAYTEGSFIFVFAITLIASIIGSITLYILGYYLGNPILKWLENKFPKIQKHVNKAVVMSEKYGNKGVLICRFIPAIRTIVSLVSGTLKEDLRGFIIYSTIGIGIWNFVLIVSGYITVISVR